MKQTLVRIGNKIVDMIDWASLNMMATFYAIKYIWAGDDKEPTTLNLNNIHIGE